MVGFALSASLCFDIGVANVTVIQTSLTRGTAPGIYMGLGATTSDLLYAILSLVGLSLLLNNIYTLDRWYISSCLYDLSDVKRGVIFFLILQRSYFFILQVYSWVDIKIY